MREFAIFITSFDPTLVLLLQEMNTYHGRNLPVLTRNQVYRQVTPDCLIVRTADGWSPGDLLDHLTMTLPVGCEDRMYCVRLQKEFNAIRHRNHQSSGYLISGLDAVSEVDLNGPYCFTAMARHLFYLANYLYMLECDIAERSRFPTTEYVLSDRFQTWTTEKPYSLKHQAWRNSAQTVSVTAHATFSRFVFADIASWLRQCAAQLGFSLKFVKEGMIYDNVNEAGFADSEIIFVGKPDWTSSLPFFLNQAIAARHYEIGKKEWEVLYRRSTEHWVAPSNAIREGNGYHQCIADAREPLSS